ncbi:MAG: DNA-3-methyladenine glycosylase [Ignavibacteria bacterium]|jgi:DNA-3-methyladenine glycosylase|nr:DNA-3-methyladenine glycosylase [Ignavibacteria bacterium]HEX2962567.1 DNA-3-methyladenine glycosylase [Ignavibacteriales bacterium]MCU7500146.1 DNA-3-methyladenine glycosylase [Ignavibacteria bacterium]MCU7511533.1 DNA-3-methyladenine glycosylase [Ignavibacteria bacterium]MCU7521038.1 DNA-3-methyladenine glycosylase [Ignavibacteria bacterium]
MIKGDFSRRKLTNRKLTREFYTGDLIPVAKSLLGKTLVKEDGDRLFAGRIVEVEAYDGAVDEAAHTFIGRTPRNEIMFGIGGYLYVYFTYGMYFCCNVVTGHEGEGKAVLLRAVEPIEGIEAMVQNRMKRDLVNIDNLTKKEYHNLTSGPGKLCQAFNIRREDNGTDLLGSRIYILDGGDVKSEDIVTSRRIGITKSVELPWRFFIKNNPFVSK